METNLEDRWITEQIAAITPDWQPDVVLGAAALHSALRKPEPRFTPWAIAATLAAALLAVLAFPQTRALAQGLWEHFVLNRIDVVRLDLSDLPLDTHVQMTGMTQHAVDLNEAEHLAGFRPDTPSGAQWTTPKVTVTGPMMVGQTIHVRALEGALAKARATGVRVPPEWEGVTLRAVVGPLVGLNYPGEVEILQARPISMSIPAGFPLETFAETAFRSIGASPRDAATMAKKFVANPAWLLDVPPAEVVNLQELSLVNGPALLVEDYDDNGKVAKDTVIRSSKDRIYVVSTPSRDLSVKIASALP